MFNKAKIKEAIHFYVPVIIMGAVFGIGILSVCMVLATIMVLV